MNIRFGMNNFYTRYLKRFLNHHLTRSSSVLGDFQVEDLQSLIKYLNYPNTETIFEVQKRVLQEYPDLSKLFVITLEDDEIVFSGKIISTETSVYLQENVEAINDFCETMGWRVGSVSNWIDVNYDINGDGKIDEEDKRILNDIIYNNAKYPDDVMRKADINLDGYRTYEDLEILDNYIDNNKIYFKIQTHGRENIFPNKDMLVFVNQFEGDFLYNYAIRDVDGVTDVPHPNYENKYKVGLYKCKPRTKTNHLSRLFWYSTFSNW